MLKNLVYFGSAQFTADIFEALVEAKIANIVAVVTTPDRPVGRKQVVTPSPLALAAEKYNLPVYKPEKLDSANLAHLKLLKPDIFLVVAYGQYFNQDWLTSPSVATLNIHFSLLPKYRGSLCVSEAIKNGDAKTGVTLMVMGEKLDAGPIIDQQEVEIDTEDNTATLTEKLSVAAVPLLVKHLSKDFSPKPQDEQEATYTPSFKTRTKQNAFINFDRLQKAMDGVEALSAHNFIRSQNPDPGAWTTINDQKVNILESSLENNKLVIDKVLVPGKNPISWNKLNLK